MDSKIGDTYDPEAKAQRVVVVSRPKGPKDPRRIGSILGIAGGAIAVAGFFALPWLTFKVDLSPLGALASVAQQAFFGGTVPEAASVSGYGLLTLLSGGLQGLTAISGAPAGAPQPDLGAAGGIATLIVAVIALVLILAILTAVASVVNLLKGRLRAGMIGFGAGTMVLSALVLFGLQMIINAAYGALQGLAGGGLSALPSGQDIGTLLRQIFSLSVGTGIYLCIIGGALGVAGGIMGRKREKKAPAPAEAPAAAPAAEPQK